MKRLLTIATVCLIGALHLPAAQATTPTCFGLAATKVGTNANNVIKGTSGTDVIVAKGGNDTVYAGGGEDYICGGSGKDVLYGDRTSAKSYATYSSNDYMSGGLGDDRLSADGNGDSTGDLLIGNGGNDYLDGGPVNRNNGYADYQEVDYNDASGPITVTVPEGYDPTGYYNPGLTITVTGDGTDTLVNLGVIGGSPYNDTFTVKGSLNAVSGAGGDDRVTLTSTGSAVDILGDGNYCRLGTGQMCPTPAGVEGNDTLTFNGSYVEDEIAGQGGNDVINGPIQTGMINGVLGGSGNDTFNGDMAQAYGGDGDDTFNGGAATDEFYGGDGYDTLNGGGGNDTLGAVDYVEGNDHVDGGAGTDSCTADNYDSVVNCP